MAKRLNTAPLVLVLALICLAVKSSEQKNDCKSDREEAEKRVKQQERGSGGHLAIVVPKCNSDNTYASLQCHHNSNFCQCWDQKGYPLSQPSTKIKKCSCISERANAIAKIPASQVGTVEVTSCETDGSFTARQCNRSACWCVNPETGKKLGSEDSSKKIKC